MSKFDLFVVVVVVLCRKARKDDPLGVRTPGHAHGSGSVLRFVRIAFLQTLMARALGSSQVSGNAHNKLNFPQVLRNCFV